MEPVEIGGGGDSGGIGSIGGLSGLSGIGGGLAPSGTMYGLPPSPGMREPEVRLKVVSATDETMNAITRRVLMSKMSALRACYGRALSVDPSISGLITLDLKVGAGGEVKGATMREPLAAGLDACVLMVARGLRFPKPKGGDVEAAIELRFSAP